MTDRIRWRGVRIENIGNGVALRSCTTQPRCKEDSGQENKYSRGPTDNHSPIRLVRRPVHFPLSCRTGRGCALAQIVPDSSPRCFPMICERCFPATYVQTRCRKTLDSQTALETRGERPPTRATPHSSATRLLQVVAPRAPIHSFLSATIYLVSLEPFPAETSARQ